MATLVGYTNTFKFGLINFDIATWHDAEWSNWNALDTLLAAYFGSADFVGVWLNSTAYTVGNIATDNDTSTLWTCVTGHTSHASNDFATDRVNNPSYWEAFGAGFDVEAAIAARNDAEGAAAIATLESRNVQINADAAVTDAQTAQTAAETAQAEAEAMAASINGNAMIAMMLNSEAQAIIDGTVMGGATSGVAGTQGDVPQPVAGDQVDVLFGDATWKTAFGKQTIFLPSGYFKPTVTAGCDALTQEELATNDIVTDYLIFDPATEMHAYAWVPMPKSWNAGTFTAKVLWKHPAATSYNALWGIAMRAYSNGDALDQALGTEVEILDGGGTTNDYYLSDATAAITPSGTPAKEDFLYVELARKAADGTDSLDVDAHLLGVLLYYTTDALVDD